MLLYCLAQSRSPYLKVGITTRPIEHRLRQYDTHSPHTTKVLLSRPFPDQESLTCAESWVHEKLKRFRHPRRQEWFRAPITTVARLFAQAPIRRG